MADRKAALKSILRAAPGLMHVLEVARDLALPDWLVFSGAVYQPVWNHLTGRAPGYGIKDYDLGYFDPADLSAEGEEAVTRRVAAAFEPPFHEMVEPCNQARVHLWFEDYYGEAYSPLQSSAEALERFTATAFAVGVRLEPSGKLTIEAPFGLDDLFAMRLRPNPKRATRGFDKSVANVRSRWPELTIG